MAHCSSSTAEVTTSPKPNLDKQTRSQLNINLTGTLLTPVACSSLINELLKTLVFQKSQIPYPYNWLKSVIDRKRKKDDDDNKEESGNNNNGVHKCSQITMEKQFRLASSTYDNLEDIMCHIRKEIENCEVQEVVLLFGPTPFTPKQVFSIKLPAIARGHLEVNHHQRNNRNQHNVLRQILLSDIWTDATGKTMASTNMYVMLKKKPVDEFEDDDFFHPNQKFSLSPRVENVVINFFYENDEEYNCCSDLQIFGGDSNSSVRKNANESSESDDCEWYQARTAVKGFKDHFVGKVSASDLW